MPESLSDHEIECIRWRAAHGGWVKTEWKNQHALNTHLTTTLAALETRITALEKKIVWVVAITTIFAQLIVGYFFK